MQRLMTEVEVAEILAIAPATLRRWRWAGRGPAFKKIGGAVRYDPKAVVSFVTAAERESTIEDA